MKRKILLVDDEEIFLRPLARTITSSGYLVETAGNAAEAKEKLKKGEFDLVISDVRMPGTDGIAFTRSIREEFGDLPVILMTAYGSIRTAVDAMKAGAHDYLLKPFEPDEILLHVRRTLEIQDLRTADRFRTARNQETFDLRKTLVWESPAMSRLQRDMADVLPLDTTVLLTGETGTGKQLIARALHYNGPRRDGPLIEVNCAAIPETLFETELFGHVRGAFTGAVSDRKGMFQLAHGGTLFLDEIGEVPLPLQPKLLTAIQDRTFLRVGGARQIDVDVRIIAATNKSLEEEVAAGRFRNDLFFRLSVYPLKVPPLRERAEDIPVLADFFLRRFARKCGKKIAQLSVADVDALRAYDWPGNVRELENFVERAVIRASGERVDFASVLSGTPRKGVSEGVPLHPELPFRDAKEKVVSAFERGYIRESLRKADGKLTEAARIAGMDNKNFSEKMKRHGLTLDNFW
ncbi:MAG: sigma-54-dependent Fis family transcriptional regulator [Deltaproteobacteria bacterium]|nr:sigma-54-dependent Fis family transcriptional regulator [Deltaproteobacteria bacterium]